MRIKVGIGPNGRLNSAKKYFSFGRFTSEEPTPIDPDAPRVDFSVATNSMYLALMEDF